MKVRDYAEGAFDYVMGYLPLANQSPSYYAGYRSAGQENENM